MLLRTSGAVGEEEGGGAMRMDLPKLIEKQLFLSAAIQMGWEDALYVYPEQLEQFEFEGGDTVGPAHFR